MPPLVYQPAFVRGLSVVTWVLLAVALLGTAAQDPREGLRWLPVLALVAGAVYAMFWRPSVEVDDEGVTVRNVLRDVRVPWPRLDAVDTRYSLALYFGERRVTAWAAPAPGRSQALRQSRRDALALQALGTDLQHGLRSSSTPNSDSGGAALMVRSRWEQALARPGAVADAGPVRVRVAVVPLVALLAPAAGTVVAVLVS